MIGPAAWARKWARIVRLLLHLLAGVLIAALLFSFQRPERRRRHVERWSRRLLAIIGARLRPHGAPAAGGGPPLVLVANHVSWVDICAINAMVPSRFVAKAEVRRWPVIGWLCARVGTIFIERSRRHDTARVNREIAAALREGDVFALFPEGTTTDGSTVLEFHPSLLAPAVAAGAAVQPVALRYERSDGSLCTEAAYDGERSAWDALTGIAIQRETIVRIFFLEPMMTAENHRRDLARSARDAILLRLFPRARDSRSGKAGGLRASLP